MAEIAQKPPKKPRATTSKKQPAMAAKHATNMRSPAPKKASAKTTVKPRGKPTARKRTVKPKVPVIAPKQYPGLLIPVRALEREAMALTHAKPQLEAGEVTSVETVHVASPPSKYRMKAMLAGIVILFSLVLGLFQLQATQDRSALQSRIPNVMQQQVSFPIYVPKDSTYTVQQDSFNYNAGSLRYYVTTGDKKYIVTQQEKPTDFSLEYSVGGQKPGTLRSLSTSNGKVVVGLINGYDTAVLMTATTVVTVIPQSLGSNQDTESLVLNMVKVN